MKLLKTEFIAENELIEIITNRNIPEIKLITVYQINKGTYGPFQPLERHKVPIWLAILFKNKHKCKIINPEFLDPSIFETNSLSKRTTSERTAIIRILWFAFLLSRNIKLAACIVICIK